jgi:hypothetical protein
MAPASGGAYPGGDVVVETPLGDLRTQDLWYMCAADRVYIADIVAVESNVIHKYGMDMVTSDVTVRIVVPLKGDLPPQIHLENVTGGRVEGTTTRASGGLQPVVGKRYLLSQVLGTDGRWHTGARMGLDPSVEVPSDLATQYSHYATTHCPALLEQLSAVKPRQVE